MATSDLKLEIVVDGKKAEGSIKNFGKTVEQSLKGGIKSSLTFSNGLQALATTVVPAMIGAFAFDKIIDGFSEVISSASDVEESINAVNVVFEEGSDIIHAFGQNSARAVGLATSEFNQMATTTGALLKNTGLSLNEVAENTIDLTKRAADMASVFNTDVSDAMSAINQALRGETEAIRRYAGDVTEASLEQFRLAQGMDKSVKSMSEAEKRLLRLQLIMEQTKDTAGDFANTSDSLANQQRILSAQLENISAAFGKLLLPAVSAVLKPVGNLVDFFERLTKSPFDKFNSDLQELKIQLEAAGASTEELQKLDFEIRVNKAEQNLQSVNGKIDNVITKLAGVGGVPFFDNLDVAAAISAKNIKLIDNSITALNEQSIKPLLDGSIVFNKRIKEQEKAVKAAQRELQIVVNTTHNLTAAETDRWKIAKIGMKMGKQRRDAVLKIKEEQEKLNRLEAERANRLSTDAKLELENAQKNVVALREIKTLILEREAAEKILENTKKGVDIIDKAKAERDKKAAEEKKKAQEEEKTRLQQLIDMMNKYAAAEYFAQKEFLDGSLEKEARRVQELEMIKTLAREASRIENEGLIQLEETEELKLSKARQVAAAHEELRRGLNEQFKQMNNDELIDYIETQEQQKAAGEDWSQVQEDILNDAKLAQMKATFEIGQYWANMYSTVIEALGMFSDEMQAIRDQEAAAEIERLDEEFEARQEDREREFEAQEEAKERQLEADLDREERQLQARINDINANTELTQEEKRMRILAERQASDAKKKAQRDAVNDFKKNNKEELQSEREKHRDKLQAIKDAAKKQGALEKTVAISRTLISTYEAATKAMAALSGIPIVGPALGFAAAAAAIAAGLSNISRITAAEEGAVINEPTLTMVGEGSEPEIVAPKSKFEDFIDAQRTEGNPEMLAAISDFVDAQRTDGNPEMLAAISAGLNNVSRIIAAKEDVVINEPTLTMVGEEPEIDAPKSKFEDFAKFEDFVDAQRSEGNPEMLAALARIETALKTGTIRTEISGRNLAIIVEYGNEELSSEEF